MPNVLLFIIIGIIFLITSIVMINKIVSMVIDSEITGMQSLYYLTGFMFFIIGIISFPLVLKIIILVLGVLFVALLDPLKNYINKTRINDIYIEKIKNYEEIVKENPHDWYTLSEIAHSYLKLKDYEKAVEIQADVVKLSGNDLEETKKLKSYQAYYNDSVSDDVKCWYCGVYVPRGVDRCYNCNKSLILMENIKSWLLKGGFQEILINTAILCGILFFYTVIMGYISEDVGFIINIIFAVLATGYIVFKILKKE